MRHVRKPLHCVDNVCSTDDRCLFCHAHKSQPCRSPKYARAILQQVVNPVLHSTLSDDCTSVIVTDGQGD